MDTNRIPDLNTLRLGRGGGRGPRSRGLRSRRNGTGDDQSEPARDDIVQSTDRDAAQSRLSAVNLGYLDDPFAKLFAPGTLVRRYPIINRGTYVRTAAIDHLIQRFLTTSSPGIKQIISLGAGTDTRYFRLLPNDSKLSSGLVYHELDFATTTTTKINTIQQNDKLKSVLPDLELAPDRSNLYSLGYNIHAIDLRDIGNPESSTLPDLPNLRRDVPTLLLSECCLVYLTPAVSTRILSTFSNTFPASTPVALVLYEPMHPHDPFGKTMVFNLSQRGIVLESLETYHDLDTQKRRFKDVGFDCGQSGTSVLDYWKTWVKEDEKERVAKCEMVDEVEEWELLAKHYCVCWGWRDGDFAGTGLGVFSRAWAQLEEGKG